MITHGRKKNVNMKAFLSEQDSQAWSTMKWPHDEKRTYVAYERCYTFFYLGTLLNF